LKRERPDNEPVHSGPTVLLRLLRKAVDVKPFEARSLVLGFAYYFFVLSGYYVIRPIRDDAGAAAAPYHA
jgi:AAA family ATP:ADP antiporter